MVNLALFRPYPMPTPRESTAVLLMAHGSKRAEANADLRHVADELLSRGSYQLVEVSYLELAEPSIPDGGRTCVARGAKRVLMMPYFLSAGRHVTTDLEQFRQQLAAEFPDVEFRLCAPLGLHPKIVDVVLDRLNGTEEA